MRFATNCAKAYARASTQTRRRFSQAVFTRIEVRDEKIADVGYHPAFDMLFSSSEFEYSDLVEAMGLEPTNLLTASQALYQLSYAPELWKPLVRPFSSPPVRNGYAENIRIPARRLVHRPGYPLHRCADAWPTSGSRDSAARRVAYDDGEEGSVRFVV